MKRKIVFFAWKARKNFHLQEKKKLSFCSIPKNKNTTLLTWVEGQINRALTQMHGPSELQGPEKLFAQGFKAPWGKLWNLLFSKNNQNSRSKTKWKKPQKFAKVFLLMLLVQSRRQALMVFVISSLSLTNTLRMHVLKTCDTGIKRCKNSKCSLAKLVLLALCGLIMAPSIRTKVSISFLLTTKSSENTLFLKLWNRMVPQSDTTKQLLKLREIF